jgi:hypothetical protein
VTAHNANNRAKRNADNLAFCTERDCPIFNVSKYLAQLQELLPSVPPVPIEALRSLHNARDYKGMVQLIKRAMNIADVTFQVFWVAEDATKYGKNTAAWVELPDAMPFFGTDEFKNLSLKMFFRKQLLEQWTYDKAAIVIAHELSHVVLESIRHPLRRCEKAVDLTAMLLGFRRLYASGSYTEEQSRNRKAAHQLGYLAPHEVQLADRALSEKQPHRIKAIAAPSWSWLGTGAVVLFVIAAVSVFVSGIPRKQAVENKINTEIQQPPANVIYDPVLVDRRVEAGMQIFTFKVNLDKIDIDAAALNRNLRKTVCADHWALIISKGVRVRVRDASNGSFTTFDVRSCP